MKVLILEDEPYTLEFFQKLVAGHPLVTQVVAVSKGTEAISRVAEFLPDVALLDIELADDDELNGIKVAQSLEKFCHNIQFIFLTGYAKYALDSFLVHPYDYIVKPVVKEKLLDSLTGIFKRTKDTSIKKEPLILKVGDRITLINPDDVYFVEKKGFKSYFHCLNEVHEVNNSLNKIIEFLPSNFIRVHQAFIVNINKIFQIENLGNRSYAIHFREIDKIAFMSRYKYEEFKDKFAATL